ncbi:MAG TPA: AraC family transcriptional regulator [Planctomycetota bacterium]|jgi:AraC-like DNA-binding protein
MAQLLPHDAPLGTWWQIRNSNLCERIDCRRAWWLEQRDRKPDGVVLFQYTLRGMMVYRDADGTRSVPAGCAVLLISGENTGYGFTRQVKEPYETLWLSFSGAGMAEHWSAIRARFGAVVQLGQRCSVIDHAKRLCQFERPKNLSELVQRASDIHAFVRHLYAFLETASLSGKSPVERAVDELLNCPDGNVALKAVASQYGVSREHLTRVFVERQGLPPSRYLARAKITRATSLLTETKLTVAAVAQQCGFGSKQSLIRWMRREIGCLPNEIRQRSR